MQGPPDKPGVNPRALFKLFKETQDRSNQGWTFETEVAMLEIYNEKVRDLIGEHQNLEIRGNATIKGLVWTKVHSVEEVRLLLFVLTRIVLRRKSFQLFFIGLRIRIFFLRTHTHTGHDTHGKR